MTPSNGNKIALVTGANKGIGYEIARGLAKHGMTVVLGCRDLGRAKIAAERLKADGHTIVPMLLDVTRPETIRAAADKIDSTYQRLDVLVNNAGIAADFGSKPSQTDLDSVRKVYETNVFGVIAVTQAMLPLILRSPAGRIVNVSSHLGSLRHASDPNNPMSKFLSVGYSTSKSALDAVTVQFANELRDTPVKVNAICPGYVATDLNNNSGPRTPEQGARIAIEMSIIPEDGPTAGFFDEDGRVPW
jgi:NAD(P)-dependent dehydrogenase (short-subunit alcohol dehydrogenase family)